MARLLLAIGWLATALLAATLASRFTLVASGEGAAAHVVASFVALLLAVLAHAWIAVFLLGSWVAVRRTVREHALDPLLVESGRRLRWTTIVLAVAASALTAALFVLRSGLAIDRLSAPWQWTAAALALALQVTTLVVEGRAVRRNEGVLDDVATRLRGR